MWKMAIEQDQEVDDLQLGGDGESVRSWEHLYVSTFIDHSIRMRIKYGWRRKN